MKTLINKIKRNLILPLAVAGGIYNSIYGQEIVSFQENESEKILLRLDSVKNNGRNEIFNDSLGLIDLFSLEKGFYEVNPREKIIYKENELFYDINDEVLSFCNIMYIDDEKAEYIFVDTKNKRNIKEVRSPDLYPDLLEIVVIKNKKSKEISMNKYDTRELEKTLLEADFPSSRLNTIAFLQNESNLIKDKTFIQFMNLYNDRKGRIITKIYPETK